MQMQCSGRADLTSSVREDSDMKVQHTKVIVAAAAGAALVALAAGPALAAGDTTTTFTLAGNGIAVTVPATANLSSAASTLIGVPSLSGSLRPMSASQRRRGLAVAWIATRSPTDFTTAGP